MTALCPSCQKSCEAGAVCASCGALLPLEPGASHFQVLGLPERYDLGDDRLEARFKELHKLVHPDRHAQRAPDQRRLALQWTTALNDAHRVLKHPLARAVYLLRIRGIDLEKPGVQAARMPVEFLEEVMDQREALGLAKARGDLETVRQLAGQSRERAEFELGKLREHFEQFELTGQREELHRAAASATVLKYLQRFEEEVEAAEMDALELE